MRARVLARSLLAALAAGLTLASSASAVTRYVDDDRKQCPQAAFTKIQAAIDASARIDVVRVCAGTYPEQLTLPAGAPGLFVASLPALAAHIVPPVPFLVPDRVGNPSLTLVRVLGDQQRFNGFAIGGPVHPSDLYDACLSAEGIAVTGAAAVVDANAITNLNLDTECRFNGFPYFVALEGVHVAAPRVVVERNTITQTPIAVAVSYGSDGAAVQANTIVGAYPDGTGIAVRNDAGGPGRVSIRSNDVSTYGTGIHLDHARAFVKGNTLHDNLYGLRFDDGGVAEIDGNVVRHNAYDGLQIGYPAPGSSLGGVIRANDAHYNGSDGIAIFGCDVDCATGPSSFTVDHNSSGSNGRYDCFDLRAANDVWIANIGVTDSPASLCSPH
jgi:hypothetical protein